MADRADAALVRQMAAGDCTALRTLYDRHAPWLSVRLTRRCNDPELVADALQDTFLAAWRAAGTWREEGEVAAWLWGIAVRRLISRLRARPHARPVPQEQLADALGSTPSVEEQVLLAVEYGDLGGALDRLSPQLRAVVQATVLDGLSVGEAATLLGIPRNTVKTRMHRARARLRRDLVWKLG